MKVREFAKTHGGDAEFDVVPVCARIESELAELGDADRLEMLTTFGSLAGVRRATREELAAVVGAKAADSVLAFFANRP